MPEYIEYFYNRESSCRACGAKVNPMRLDYPNSLDAVHRIIKGMTYGTELYRYHSYLTAMFEASVGEYAYVKMLTATAQQQFVAAAMALGLIKETK
jgi:hypothetical protein